MAQVGDSSDQRGFQDLGLRLGQVVQWAAVATDNRPLASAAHALRNELATAGLDVDEAWCRRTLEAIRRGETPVLEPAVALSATRGSVLDD